MTKKIKTGIKDRLKYAVLNKKTGKIDLYYYKTHVAELLGVSTRTILRNKTYENDHFKLFEVGNVVLTHATGYNRDILRWDYPDKK